MSFSPSDELLPQGLNARGALDLGHDHRGDDESDEEGNVEAGGGRIQDGKTWHGDIRFVIGLDPISTSSTLTPSSVGSEDGLFITGELNYARGLEDGTRSYHQLDWTLTVPIATWMTWPVPQGGMEDWVDQYEAYLRESDDLLPTQESSTPVAFHEDPLDVGFGQGSMDRRSHPKLPWSHEEVDFALEDRQARMPFPRLTDIIATRVTRTKVVERGAGWAKLLGRTLHQDLPLLLRLERATTAHIRLEVRCQDPMLIRGLVREVGLSLSV